MTLTAAMRRALIWMVLVVLTLTVALAIAANVLSGIDGLLSALVGGALAIGFTGMTLVSVVIASRVSLDRFLLVIFGMWLAKMAIFLVIILVVREQAFVVPAALVGTMLVGAAASLVVDFLVLLRSRTPIIDEPTRPGEARGDAGSENAPTL